MQLFHHKLSLPKIDPLGGGLREEIIIEQEEPEAITLDDAPDTTLPETWGEIVQDLEADPDWFQFADDES